ncbi:arginine N-methyltransferase, putative [Entamoeba histolytica KU27]|uniref:Protein arginine N-methyltransferase n=1 Tax=Entamoeba histolytica KU27 TaxID=885311 RepID=M2RM02_ENTHI|nr:arginine N-methyltransferase, putative [Entamoeba histolytica KU27]
MTERNKLSIGVDLSSQDFDLVDVSKKSDKILQSFSFISVPLSYEFDVNDQEEQFQPTFSDSYLDSSVVSSRWFGKLSLFDCSRSLEYLYEELQWVNHIRLPCIIIPEDESYSIEYIKCINTICSITQSIVWISLLLDENTWKRWNTLRKTLGYNLNIRPLLILQNKEIEYNLLSIWRAENVSGVVINKSLINEYGKIPRSLEIFIQSLMDFDIAIILKGYCCHVKEMQRDVKYFEWLKESRMKISRYEETTIPYRDQIEIPIQPLSENLESIVYESFEKEPFKYEKYREAIIMAIQDKSDVFSKSTPLNPFKIVIAGAGRGPLIAITLEICKNFRIEHKTIIYAIEKNPNAIATLKFRKNKEYWNNVKIIFDDMRNVHMEKQIDIVISELLGSFGDNELSPECLDCLLPQVLKDDGISIPYRYTNYIQPISSALLFTKMIVEQHSFELPCVCNHYHYQPLSSPQQCFRFEHPTSQINHSRYITLSFPMNYDAVIHGFSGTFNVDLYKTVKLSIVPNEHSPEMYSWFPLFFPLISPIEVKRGDILELKLWRCETKFSVWYEWLVTSPVLSRLHNAGGKYSMSLQRSH